MRDADCVFCRILAGTEEASFVFRDERVAAFMDIVPVNQGHLLVVPVRHAARLTDLDPADGARMFEVAHKAAAALGRAGLKCEGVNLFLADGAAAGQDIMHVHLHVFPRNRGDGFGLRLPPGYGTRPARAELDRIAGTIRSGLQQPSPLDTLT
jgi:histidine triad (HIT) family protein